ncbi:WD40 repeat-like protein [Armillaria solidipes]|uniref:WD40 repeat-like protein n=1 Tax=Armillaria solidipes TaxID=1076256 RepID=A0A2H3APQ6_9AGAR|nr:WD40 repeat-like protein [Armillaria solidipes]
MIRLPFFHNSHDDYHLVLRIPSQSNNALCFTPDGRYLASGGDDKTVNIWSLHKCSCCQTLEYNNTHWGQITCMSFIGEEGVWLAFGTSHGLIYIYGRAKGGLYRYNGGIQASSISNPVESLAFDGPSNKLMVTSHFGHILAYNVQFFETKVTFHQEWSKTMRKAIPRTTTFINEGKEVLVGLLNTGEMMTLASDSSATIATKSVNWPIGNCTSNITGNMIILQNMAKGFDLYKLPELIKTCSIETKTRLGLVKDVRFAENGSIAVGGSDSRKVYVIDLKLGAVVQELPHGKDHEVIQAVDTFSSSDCYLIASASGTGSREPMICLWEKPTKLGVNRRRNGQWKVQWLLIGLCILVLAFLIYRVSSSWWATVVRLSGLLLEPIS